MRIYLYLHLFIFMSLLVQGCQKSTTSNIDNEILGTEMTSDFQCNDFHKEIDCLLTKEEARQALLVMVVQEEEANRIRSNIYKKKSEKLRETYEEYKRKEMELLESAESNEDLEEPLQNLREEAEEQMDKVRSYYETVNQEFGLARERNTEFENMEGGYVEYEKPFEDYVVIPMNTPTIYPLPDGDWECDLKNGLFRRYVRRLHGDVVIYGRFKKAENGEWIAIETGWGNAFYISDIEDDNMLTAEEAKQALLTMRLNTKRRSYISGLRSIPTDEAEEYERVYSELYEKFTESEYQFAHDYTDYTVVEIAYMMRVIKDEDTTGRDYEVVEQWHCDLKEGLCRYFWSHGNGGNSITYGRFKKADNGEWIAVIIGWDNVYYNSDKGTWETYNLE